MKFNRHQEEENTQVDISPLIDMVFILLIFFMVSTTFVKDMKVDIHRPGASSAKAASSQAIRVAIDRSGQIFVDNQPVRPWVLQGKIKEMLSEGGGSKSVLVLADKAVSAEKLIQVVDDCRLAGASDVGVATENET
jgi:biopolymer transport protein ExbD